MERSLGADLMEELTKPPCLLGAVGPIFESLESVEFEPKAAWRFFWGAVSLWR